MSVLSFKDLCRVFDCRQAGALRRLLVSRKIRFSRDRRGRPWTTEAELDRAIAVPEKPMSFTFPPRRVSSVKRRER